MEILMFVKQFSITFDTHCHIHFKEANDIIKNLLQIFDISFFLHSNPRRTKLNIQNLKIDLLYN